MSVDAFTGRAQDYTNARPGYTDEVIEYIGKLVPADAVFVEVGAGTGKFTELLARQGYKIFAVEPNTDMREQLAITLASFPDVKIVAGSAEVTTLPDNSVDVIVSAQALNWFDIDAFRIESQRIGKSNPMVISVYNYNPSEEHGISRYKKSTAALYSTPIIREFSNPICFTQDKWLQYFFSMAGVPNISDPNYYAYSADLNKRFDCECVDGVLCLNLITCVYSEKL